MTTTELIVPTYTQLLTSLSGWLKKAETQSPNADTLLSARLAEDMYPLATQIRFSCVQAYEAVYRLKGENFPESINQLLDEGRNANDEPGSLADAQTRIEETLSLLNALSPNELDAHSVKPLAHALPNGMILDLTTEQYARDWTLSQFYFHVMIAYAILRKEKIELGKADYIAHMLPFLRPETLPDN
jgi:hypothetical protein